jgi:hypothetical protein
MSMLQKGFFSFNYGLFIGTGATRNQRGASPHTRPRRSQRQTRRRRRTSARRRRPTLMEQQRQRRRRQLRVTNTVNRRIENVNVSY